MVSAKDQNVASEPVICEQPPTGSDFASAVFRAADAATRCVLEIANILGVKLERASDPFNRIIGELSVYGDAAEAVWQARLGRECAGHPGDVGEHAKLLAAVKDHHIARGHDRCWENDAALYRAAGLEPGDQALPPREEFRRRCQEYEAGQYAGASDEAVGDSLRAAPWAEMLAQAEAMFRNVLETSPVLADLRARLDALQNDTARTMAAERILAAGKLWLRADGPERRTAERLLEDALCEQAKAERQQTAAACDETSSHGVSAST